MLPAGRDPSTSAFISVKIETQGLTDQQEQVRILFSNITKKKKKIARKADFSCKSSLFKPGGSYIYLSHLMNFVRRVLMSFV